MNFNFRKFIVTTFLTILLLAITIDLPAPIIVYGSQIVLIFLLIIIRFLLYPKFNIKNLLFGILVILFIEFLAIYQITYLKYTEIFWLNTHRTLVWIVSAIFLYDYFKNRGINYLIAPLNMVILVHALTIFAQIISYYILGSELDYSVILGGESVRSLFSLNDINYRPTGLTAEPSIYSGFMTGLLCLKYIINKRIDVFFLLGISSILGTFSTLGIMIAFIILTLIYIKNMKNILIGVLIVSSISSLFIDSVKARIELFMLGDDGSNNVKIEILQSFFSNENIKLFGYGFIGKSSTAPTFYEGLYDLTLYLNIFIYWGIIFGSLALIILVFLLFKSKYSVKEKILIMVTFIKLSGPTLIFFSFFVSLLLAIHNYRRRLNKI